MGVCARVDVGVRFGVCRAAVLHHDEKRLLLRRVHGQAVGAARHCVPDVEPAAGRVADARAASLRSRRDQEDGRELDSRRLRVEARRGDRGQFVQVDQLRPAGFRVREARPPHLRPGRLSVAAGLVPGRVVYDAPAGGRCGRHSSHQSLAVGHHQLRASHGPIPVLRVDQRGLRAVQELQGDRRVDHRQRVRLPRPLVGPAGRVRPSVRDRVPHVRHAEVHDAHEPERDVGHVVHEL